MRLLLLALAIAAAPAHADPLPGLGDPSYLRSLVARALAIDPARVVQASAVSLDGAKPHLGAVIGRYREGEWTFAVVVPLDRCPDGQAPCLGPPIRLGGARDVALAGAVDLLAPGSIDPGGRVPAASHPRWPALIARATTNSDLPETQAWLISLRSAPAEILFARVTSRHYPDGGGFSTHEWRIAPREGKPGIVAVEQHELSSRHARCMLPKPEEHRFQLDPAAERLVELAGLPPRGGCGD